MIVGADGPDARRDALLSDGLVGVRDACRMLGVSRPSVFQLMNDGTLPWLRVTGRKRLIPRAAINAFLASRLRVGPAGADGKVA